MFMQKGVETNEISCARMVVEFIRAFEGKGANLDTNKPFNVLFKYRAIWENQRTTLMIVAQWNMEFWLKHSIITSIIEAQLFSSLATFDKLTRIGTCSL